MITSHANISVFVPHIGCPNRCSFCDQIHITGTAAKPTAKDVETAVETALANGCDPKETEIAFFGGSFTAIDGDYRLELLSAAYKYVKNGNVKGIRISTRPDAIDPDILSELKAQGVTAIELGAQSMDDGVLLKNLRGHNSQAVVEASRMIKASGFSLGLQMMTGLFGSNNQKDLMTAQKIAALKPQTVRIYPTIVFKNTFLAKKVESGEYTPQRVTDAAALCARLQAFFEQEEITVIRTGLHSIDNAAFVAGPWHPAFGELCASERYKNAIFERLADLPHGNYTVFVARGDISKAVGQHRDNIKFFEKNGYGCRVKENEYLKNFQVIIEKYDR